MTTMQAGSPSDPPLPGPATWLEANALAAAGESGPLRDGVELTLRELQDQLKAKSHPWERAKAFDGACPLSSFVAPAGLALTDIPLQLKINGEIRQQGSSAEMITPIIALLQHIAGVFTLQPGDVVLTGTPAGVGPLTQGDQLVLELVGLSRFESHVL